jgi:diguanylate cyclase (GGDEF)-like protein
VDNFKALNDTRGHGIGDLLLIELAQRLRGMLREGDTVARQGGDEFVVLLEDLAVDVAEATALCKRVGDKLFHIARQSGWQRRVNQDGKGSRGVRIML